MMVDRCNLSLLFVVLTVILLVFPLPLFAAIIVDPDGTGATNVEPNDPATWTSSDDSIIGSTYDGALLVDGDSDLLSYNSTIGLEGGVNGNVKVSGIGSTWTGLNQLHIGQHGNGKLNIVDGGAVGSYEASIGHELGSMGLVTLAGPGSTWTNSSNLYIGRSSIGEMEIFSGATVQNGYEGIVGHLPDSIGTVTVYGVGSTWTNSVNLYVGDAGEGHLDINAGGTVQNDFDGIIGNQSGSIGIAKVDGLHSTWTNGGYLYVAKEGEGTLEVANGAAVNSVDGRIGYEPGSLGVVKVDGPLSTWDNSNSLHVGAGESGEGMLEITRGATVSNRDGVIAYVAGATGTVTVDGPLSTWTNTGTLAVGRNGGVATLNITNHGTVSTAGISIGPSSKLNLDGGTLELTGTMDFASKAGGFNFTSGEVKVSNGTVTDVSGTSLVGHQVLTLTGSSSHWISNNPFLLGNPVGVPSVDNAGSTLHIADGASLSSPTGTIGANPQATSNVTVSGTGSTWDSGNELAIHNGTLDVIEGGAVNNISATIGREESVGSVTVDGIGSIWTSQDFLKVGLGGSGSLNVSNGGTVNTGGPQSNTSSSIGCGQDSDGSVTIDGVGSTWNSAEEINIGYGGSGTLQITGGGTVNSGDSQSGRSSTIGFGPTSNGTVTVQGDGSVWNNRCNLNVGYGGSGTLFVTDKATVYSESADIASGSDAISSVTIDGNGSTWESGVSIKVGHQGNGTLNITNGGTVHSGSFESMSYPNGGYIGFEEYSTGTVRVDGENSTWDIHCGLNVGYGGEGVLLITDNATVRSTAAFIGGMTKATGSVTINGNDSTWECGDFLKVGYQGSGTLNITGGGTVHSGILEGTNYPNGGYIAYAPDSTGNATVSGAGSTWDCPSNFVVGNEGTGSLLITDGGTVNSGTSGQNYRSTIGYGPNSNGTVTVQGNGSTWNNFNGLSVGGNSSGVLNINSGGTVSAAGLDIGFQGTLNLDGGTLELTGNTNLNNWDGAFNFTRGEIKVSRANVETKWNTAFTLAENQVLTVAGGGARWVNSFLLLIDNGTLNIQNGGSVESYMGGSCIGYAPGSTGTVVVDGIDKYANMAPARWTNNNLIIGREGNGFLDVTNGGNVEMGSGIVGRDSGSAGVVTVDGDGSILSGYSFYLGDKGDATVSVTDAGIVDVSGSSIIGFSSGSTGIATVDGAGATWNSEHLTVGYDGSGTLNIANTGLVYVGQVTRVGNSNGTIHFDGGTLDTGSLEAEDVNLTGTGTIILHDRIVDDTVVLNSPDDLVGLCRMINAEPGQNITVNWDINSNSKITAGNTGTGSLTITNGLTVPSRYGYIGRDAGATGTVAVDGPGSTWDNKSTLYVGYSGNATLDITNGATVNISTGYIGNNSDSTGCVTVDGAGSTWTNHSSLYVGYSGSGTLEVTNGATVSNFVTYVAHYSGATGTVIVNGADSTWTNRNDLHVGYSGSAILEITDSGLVSVAGTLTIDDDTDGDAFINMAAGGMLALLGEAEDSLASFLDLIEGTDAINYWDDSIADWAGITGATLGTDYTLEYLADGDLAGYTLLTVQATTAIPGDANGDGCVDGSDVTILAGNWQLGVDDGQTATWAMGDFNADGQVDGSDVTILAGNWQAGVTATTASVPEPSSLVLLLTGLLLLARFRRLR